MTNKEIKERIEEMSYQEHKAYQVYCELHDLDEYDEESLGKFDEDYYGDFDSEEDFVYHLMDEQDVPSWVQTCVDMKKAVREIFNFDYVFKEGHVFHQ